MRKTAMQDAIEAAFQMTKHQSRAVRTGVVYGLEKLIQHEQAELNHKEVVQRNSLGSKENSQRTLSVTADFSDDVLRSAFIATVEKIFESLSPEALDMDIKNSEKKSLFGHDDTLISAYRTKFDSIRSFHEQGLFAKEFLYRLSKQKKRVEK